MILFYKTPEPWADSNRMLMTCRRETAQKAVSEWKGDVRAAVALFPEQPNKWAMFDMSEHPASSYTSGRVCLAGDAAHASTPFLASGAAMGIEDAAALTTALDAELGRAGDKTTAITTALGRYSAVRLDRSQMVVRDSRAVGDMCMWQNEETGQDPDKCFAEIWGKYSRIWDFDVKEMVERSAE